MRLTLLVCSAVVACLCSERAPAADVSSPNHAVVAADRGQIAIFDRQGKLVWSFDGLGEVHSLQQLPNGNLLAQQGWQKLIEISPEKEVVWSYDAGESNGNHGKRLEVHAFQRLANGNTMLVENGIGRILEIDPQGKIVHQVKYQVSKSDAHRDVRRGSVLENGDSLLCHEGDGRVTEYDHEGNIVWDYDVPMFGQRPRPGHGPEAFGNQVFNALRLDNGNTLIATGNGHSILEVTPEKQIVWEIHQQDLPGITLAWTTSLEVLPDGNIVFGNCHAGPENPQLIEVNRDKEVVWTFHDFDTLGNATASSAIYRGPLVESETE